MGDRLPAGAFPVALADAVPIDNAQDLLSNAQASADGF